MENLLYIQRKLFPDHQAPLPYSDRFTITLNIACSFVGSSVTWLFQYSEASPLTGTPFILLAAAINQYISYKIWQRYSERFNPTIMAAADVMLNKIFPVCLAIPLMNFAGFPLSFSDGGCIYIAYRIALFAYTFFDISLSKQGKAPTSE